MCCFQNCFELTEEAADAMREAGDAKAHGVIKACVDRATNPTEVRACQTTTDARQAAAAASGRRPEDIEDICQMWD